MWEGFGAPKQSLESGTQKVCPHFFRPLFLSHSRVSKMEPQNRPLAQPWCAKCPGLTDPHLVAYPCAAAIAAATGQPIYWRTFRPILCRVQIGGSRQLRLSSASAPFSCCISMRARKARAIGSEKRWNSMARTYVWSRVARLGCHMKRTGVALLFM